MMLELSRMADSYCAREDVAGVVITHGTDTQEETCYMVGLTCRTDKPIVTTGAMRGASDTAPDGAGNILAAVMTAACPDAVGKGALLVLNNEIHAAAEVTKTHSTSCSTFDSPSWGPIGYVYYDRVVIRRQPLNLQKIQPEELCEDVYLLKSYAGMDIFLFEALANKPIKGLVVEAFGCGNVPPAVKEGIELIRSKGIPVVLATRTHAGRVVPAYSYPGSAGSMLSSGIILAGELTGQKARLKLMAALGVTNDLEQLRSYFDN